MTAKKQNLLKVKLIKSPISTQPNHKACLNGLGLRKINQSKVLNDNPCVRGMINKVDYLLSVEEVK